MSALLQLLQRMRQSSFALAVTSRVRTKLMLSFVAVSLVPCLLLGWFFQGAASNAWKQQTATRLEGVQQIRVRQVKHEFHRLQEQLLALSQDALLVDLMQRLPALAPTAREENQVDASQLTVLQEQLLQHYNEDYARQYSVRNNGEAPPVDKLFRPLDPDSVFLQHQYIRANPHPLGRKALLDRAQDFSRYSELHGRFHPYFRQVLQVLGCEDILLCDIRSGDVVYSVAKQLDFTTSLVDGPYAQTGLGKAFRQASVSETAGASCFIDYAPYSPSFEKATSFLSAPIFAEERAIGVLIFKVGLDQITSALTEATESQMAGDVYLAAAEDKAHYDSRISGLRSEDSSEIHFNIDALQAALRGESGATRTAQSSRRECAGGLVARGYLVPSR